MSPKNEVAGCDKHPRDHAVVCASCGKEACSSCGTFLVDDETYCLRCGEALVGASGLPLGTVLIATTYLALVATLTALKELRPVLLAAAALLAIALARVFAVQRTLRRPFVTKTQADDGRGNVLSAARASAGSVARHEAATNANAERSADADANAHANAEADANADAHANRDAHADADAHANADAHASADADANGNADADADANGNADAGASADGNTVASVDAPSHAAASSPASPDVKVKVNGAAVISPRSSPGSSS